MNQRSKKKFPNLDPKLNLKSRQELIEVDYLDKLNDEEKEYLDKFNKEYVNASFKKTKKGNYSSKNLHKTEEERKKIYKMNNDRNADVYSRNKAKGSLKYLEDITLKKADSRESEDKLIKKIDEPNEE